MLALGFTQHESREDVVDESLLLDFVGRSGRMWRVKNDEIAPGLSGSMAIDQKDGVVCGLVKASRDYSAPRGG
jgi:hypothetical protein